MAPGRYDVSLDVLVNNRKRKRKPRGLNSNAQISRNNFRNSKFGGNTYKNDSMLKRINRSDGKGKQFQSVAGRSGVVGGRRSDRSIKDRLTLSTGSKGNINHRKPNTGSSNIKIFKTSGEVDSPQLRLYTKHFDARSKISTIDTGSTLTKGFIKGLAKRALDDVRDTPSKAIQSNHRKSLNDRKRSHSLIENDDRQSTFTGKSIKIVAKNNLITKERTTLMKGNSLSVVTKNTTQRGRKQAKQNSSMQLTNTIKSKSASSSSTLLTSPTKKQLSAKVIISNLHPNVTQDDIKELFGAVGVLKEARLKNIGCAEVVYPNSEDAFAAYSKYHGRNLDGQPMLLKMTTADETVSPAHGSRHNHNSSNFYDQQRLSSQQYVPAALPSSRNIGSSGRPVVFTVKL